MRFQAWKVALLVASVLFHAALFASMKMPEYAPRTPNAALLFNLVDRAEKYVPPPEPPKLPNLAADKKTDKAGGTRPGENEPVTYSEAEPETAGNPDTEPSAVDERNDDIKPVRPSHEQVADTDAADTVNDNAADAGNDNGDESPAGTGAQPGDNAGNGGGSGTGSGSGDGDSDGAGQSPTVKPEPEPEPENEPQVDVKAIQNGYVASVKSKIYSCKFYPEQAKRMEHEGSVKVRFTVASGGGVSGVSVASSSGFDELDNAAVEAVKNAAPFAEIPAELGKPSLTISVTLKYYMK